MSASASILEPSKGAAWLAGEAASLLFGAGLTFFLFLGMAHFENVKTAPPAPEIEELRTVTAINEPPPPKIEQNTQPPDVTTPLTGIEIAASDSAVKLAVVPPDLAKIMPQSDLPPRATIQFNQLLTDLRPHSSGLAESRRIYQQNEVDQKPEAIVKTIARVSNYARANAPELRATLLLVIDTEGGIESIKLIRPSGNKDFDKIVTECVKEEWVFSPAVRHGKKVRCMVQQLVWYKWTGGDKFAL
ncbi:MAG TPA: energy transducer TonB [Opitutaceae bacterium]|jgi:outer membrane biosynthesis protein TonB|nr:energy transducer TonB [Opitutaceae bacterium]